MTDAMFCDYCMGSGVDPRMAEHVPCPRCVLTNPPTPSKHLHRRRAVDTSVAAANQLDITDAELRVYEAIRSFGAAGCIANDLLEMFPGLSYSTITARPKQLKERGLVIDTGYRRRGPSGRMQAVLVAADFYEEFVRQVAS